MNGTHEMDNDSIKVNIVRKRTEEGISQDEMARRLRISRNTYRSIEKGTAKVISERLNEIASSLNTSAEELVLGYKTCREKLRDGGHQDGIRLREEPL